ncbi:MAG: 1-phosphofructokinase family hexose kinase [Pseudomonadota bacterium]
MQENQIVTVTLNPALDFAADVPELIPNEKLRCDHPSMFPGGGGVNVARAIRNLGGDATACVALGGPNGQSLELLLRAEGVDVAPVSLDVQTRHSLSIRDQETGKLYRFMLPGTPWTQMIEAHFLAKVAELLGKAKYCILSGSMPPGTGVNTIRRLATICHNADCKLVVDTSGPTLITLVQEESVGIDILRANRDEARYSTTRELETPGDFAAAAAQMIERGAADNVILGVGGKGNLVVTKDGQSLFVPAPKVEVISRVGAGDSFVGAMVLALASGKSWAQALPWGAAAASVACTRPGTELCTRDETQELAATLNASNLAHS